MCFNPESAVSDLKHVLLNSDGFNSLMNCFFPQKLIFSQLFSKEVNRVFH